jgi:TatD DNase family protein
MKLFDAHCHFESVETVERAAAAGIAGMAVCSASPDDWPKLFQWLEKADKIFPTLGKSAGGRLSLLPSIGIHPRFVSEHWKESFQTLEKTVREFPLRHGSGQANIGIGETGLDFSDRFQNRPEQEECFAAHLDLARELNRPVAVHCVQAWGRLVEILRGHPAPRVLLHAFGGAPELIPELVELNCRFSFCESVTNPNAKRVRASAAAVPAERLFIETDSLDEPERLIRVARAVAELRGVPVERLAELTFSNSVEFFIAIGLQTVADFA